MRRRRRIARCRPPIGSAQNARLVNCGLLTALTRFHGDLAQVVNCRVRPECAPGQLFAPHCPHRMLPSPQICHFEENYFFRVSFSPLREETRLPNEPVRHIWPIQRSSPEWTSDLSTARNFGQAGARCSPAKVQAGQETRILCVDLLWCHPLKSVMGGKQ